MTQSSNSDSDLSKALEMYQWIKDTRPYHLNLKEVQNWQKGEKREVVMFDRNFEEYDIWENIKQKTSLPATTFFKHNKGTLTYKGDLKWDITYDFGETIEHEVHISTASLSTSWKWVNIENNHIEIKNEVLDNRVTLPSHKSKMKIPISKFPLETRVGWRGPMIEWKYLSKLPPVYWERT